MFVNSSLVKYYYINFLKLGLTSEEIQKRSGITLKLLDQVDSPISMQQLDLMCEMALERMESPAEYMRISESITPDDYGIFGTIAKHCKTIGEFCKMDGKYAPLISNSDDDICYSEDDKYLYFKCALVKSPIHDIVETSILLENLEFLRKLTKVKIKPIKVLFRHDRPLSYVEECERIFDCPLLFNQSQSSLIFDICVKDYKIQSGDDHILNVFTEYAETLLEKQVSQSDFKSKVSKMIEKNLPKGLGNIQSVADALNMSRQSVYLKLKEEGTSFSELLQDVRKSQMLRYVSRIDQSFQEISDLLGYSDVSVFYRTFKKWFDVTPKMYRKNQSSKMGRTLPK